MAEQGVRFSRVMDMDDADAVAQLLRGLGARIGHDGANKPWADTRDQLAGRASGLLRRLKEIDAQLVLRDDPIYPRQLLDLRDPPFWLFVQGDPQVLAEPSVAIVGTRDPSPDGLWLARYVGYCLRDWGAPTVSGLALGIDQEVHISSLRVGVPTIAFLGTGIFSDYPKNSEGIRASIAQSGGAIVTEYLPTESYSAKNFVKRNRLQAALAKTLIPVEWSIKSGTAHTVRYAASLGRDIAFLRVPYGRSADWIASDVARGREIFYLPQQGNEFATFVHSSLHGKNRRNDRQLSLF